MLFEKILVKDRLGILNPQAIDAEFGGDVEGRHLGGFGFGREEADSGNFSGGRDEREGAKRTNFLRGNLHDGLKECGWGPGGDLETLAGRFLVA